jgi:hypothetical protein
METHHPHPDPDPYSELEEEGIPDLEDSYPEREWAEDPQRPPVPPRDKPLALDEYGTTPEEMRRGEPLDLRLKRELPDPALDQRGRVDAGTDPIERTFDPALEHESPRPAGRLVEDDQDVRAKDAAEEVGPDRAGFTAEESAVRIEYDRSVFRRLRAERSAKP